jgi:hypothetical protein
MPALSAEASAMTPQADFESGPASGEPTIPFNFTGEIEDVMTVTPRGGFQNEQTEAEQTFSSM